MKKLLFSIIAVFVLAVQLSALEEMKEEDVALYLGLKQRIHDFSAAASHDGGLDDFYQLTEILIPDPFEDMDRNSARVWNLSLIFMLLDKGYELHCRDCDPEAYVFRLDAQIAKYLLTRQTGKPAAEVTDAEVAAFVERNAEIHRCLVRERKLWDIENPLESRFGRNVHVSIPDAEVMEIFYPMMLSVVRHREVMEKLAEEVYRALEVQCILNEDELQVFLDLRQNAASPAENDQDELLNRIGEFTSEEAAPKVVAMLKINLHLILSAGLAGTDDEARVAVAGRNFSAAKELLIANFTEREKNSFIPPLLPVLIDDDALRTQWQTVLELKTP